MSKTSTSVIPLVRVISNVFDKCNSVHSSPPQNYSGFNSASSSSSQILRVKNSDNTTSRKSRLFQRAEYIHARVIYAVKVLSPQRTRRSIGFIFSTGTPVFDHPLPPKYLLPSKSSATSRSSPPPPPPLHFSRFVFVLEDKASFSVSVHYIRLGKE